MSIIATSRVRSVRTGSLANQVRKTSPLTHFGPTDPDVEKVRLHCPAMVEFVPVAADEAVCRRKVEVDAADRERLALLDGAAPKERPDLNVLRGHGVHDGLAEPAVVLNRYDAAIVASDAIRLDGLSTGRTACAVKRKTGSSPKSSPYIRCILL